MPKVTVESTRLNAATAYDIRFEGVERLSEGIELAGALLGMLFEETDEPMIVLSALSYLFTVATRSYMEHQGQYEQTFDGALDA